MSTEVNGILYTIINDEYAIVGDNSLNNHNAAKTCPVDVSIESFVIIDSKKYEVREIGNRAFYKCISSRIVLPNTIRVINSSAFDMMDSTHVITIPDSVETIKSWAFASNFFSSITIPSNVKVIESGAFAFINNLVEIKVNSMNQNFIVENDVLYDKNKKRIIQICLNMTSIDILPSVEILDSGCFARSKITELIIPETVKAINTQVAQDLYLEKVIIHGNSVIQDKCFKNMKSFKVLYYAGKRKVKNDVFTDIYPEIFTCYGYPISTFGNKPVTTMNNCIAKPIKHVCSCAKKRNQTNQFNVFILLILW